MVWRSFTVIYLFIDIDFLACLCLLIHFNIIEHKLLKDHLFITIRINNRRKEKSQQVNILLICFYLFFFVSASYLSDQVFHRFISSFLWCFQSSRCVRFFVYLLILLLYYFSRFFFVFTLQVSLLVKLKKMDRTRTRHGAHGYVQTCLFTFDSFDFENILCMCMFVYFFGEIAFIFFLLFVCMKGKTKTEQRTGVDWPTVWMNR